MEETTLYLATDIEEMKAEIISLNSLKIKLDKQIQKDKTLLGETYSKIEETSWKIKRASFIESCEKERHENYKLKIAPLASQHLEFPCKKEAEEQENLIHKLREEEELMSKKLQNLLKFEEEVVGKLLEVKQSVSVLRNRNLAMLRKLEKQLEETENSEKTLEMEIEFRKKQDKPL